MSEKIINHGGARPAVRPDDGRRKNKRTESSGRRPKKLDPRVINLSPEAQQELRIITLHRRAISNNAALTPRQVVEELIKREWLAFDAMIQRHAEELAEVEIVDNAIIL